MKLKTILTILCLPLITSVYAQTTNLVVLTNIETELAFSVDENGKLYFDDTYLYINTDGNNVESIEISSIRKLVFAENQTSVNNTVINNADYYLYPNPATTFLRIANSDDIVLQVKIFSLNGQVLISNQISGSDQIDISALPGGFYVLKVNNKALKFTKL